MKNEKQKKKEPFYGSREWIALRRVALDRDKYICQICLRDNRLRRADTVHHIKPIKDYPELALDLNNLLSVCNICHNKLHSRRRKIKKSDDIKAYANEEGKSHVRIIKI